MTKAERREIDKLIERLMICNNKQKAAKIKRDISKIMLQVKARR